MYEFLIGKSPRAVTVNNVVARFLSYFHVSLKMAHQRAETCSETKSVVISIVVLSVIFEYLFLDFNLINCSTSRKVAGSIPDGVIGIFL